VSLLHKLLVQDLPEHSQAISRKKKVVETGGGATDKQPWFEREYSYISKFATSPLKGTDAWRSQNVVFT
jgi:hypothetical protein